MEIHTKRPMSCSGTSRRVTIYTPNGSGSDGRPAVIYDPGAAMVSFKIDQPVDQIMIQHIRDALADIGEKMLAVDAAIASEQP